MKKTYLLVFAALFMVFLTGCNEKEATEEGIHSYAELKKLLVDPPSEYRSAPLWDWNDDITEEGIAFQMEEFKKAGIGGVFVHPRPGLITEYLSDEWFHLFDYTLQKGKELDMKVWIYDENSYPSGFAGGHVPAEMPDSYQHGAGLGLEIQQELTVAPNDTIVVVLHQTENGFTDITSELVQWNGKKGDFYIFRKTYPQKSPWYGGFTYVDLLVKGVTEKFIDLTMTKGYERNSAYFGNTLPGIFTDEPNLEAAMPRGTMLRWTPGLWETFQQRWGYDLKINLPSLVEETGDWKKVRHDYYELLLELFVDRWAKPWSKYCDDRNLKWTGHYWEHGWPEPTHGFDEAAFYIWHQQPGVDMLGNKLDREGLGGQFGNDRAVRELASAANQAGRTRTLSETYGGGGWQMDFAEQKRLADWQAVLGVNFVNQHLSYYTIKGVRKFDYPPSFSYHEPWWAHYKILGDYLGRISMAMAAGQQINHTLVLQPNTTAWMYFSRKEKNPTIQTIRDGFKNFVWQLEQKHWEYDLGSENVLKELGQVNKGKMVVGQRAYSLVVIPAEMENIDQQTFELLQKYLEQGGKLLSFTRQIARLNGAESDKVNQLASQYPEQWFFVRDLNDSIANQMFASHEFEMLDKTNNGMLYHQQRMLDDGQLVFVVNSHETEKAAATVSVQGKQVIWIDLLSGKEFSYPAASANKRVSFEFELQPGGSALFAVTNKKSEAPEFVSEEKNREEIAASGEMRIKRESDNLLPINYLDLKTAKTDQKEIYFVKAANHLFTENGVEIGNPWQHKVQYKKSYLEMDSLFQSGSGFEANYHFYIDKNLSQETVKNIRAVVERPELWQIFVNGELAEKVPDAFWIDKDFPVFAIGQFLKTGKNTITLKSPRMTILTEIMPVYLLGGFLVKPDANGFVLAEGELTGMGSWAAAGLPFYSQQVSYSQNFQIEKENGCSYHLGLGQWKGTVAEVLVNGKAAGLIAWAPYELDITGELENGQNEITVQITGSLKNTFGVFYNKNDNWIWGPHAWMNAPEKSPAASDYALIDYGLFETFKVYCVK
ncbi:glycosyl hydrolase [Gaoshiqia sp. Z1-71]|uniref:glycosyl hydrolase n=1 Tax=Gaoshiqia hydrogeniformans TaxID=3290090 RepID=UPI003BF82BE1